MILKRIVGIYYLKEKIIHHNIQKEEQKQELHLLEIHYMYMEDVIMNQDLEIFGNLI